MAVKHFSDANKRKCTCVILANKKVNGKTMTFKFLGRAKCSPTDVFDEKTGKELAHLRALLKFKAWEKECHQASINFCTSAIKHLNEECVKINEKYQKTQNTINRLTDEYNELIDTL
jgi:Tfp pilus assembly major pilin PilA